MEGFKPLIQLLLFLENSFKAPCRLLHFPKEGKGRLCLLRFPFPFDPLFRTVIQETIQLLLPESPFSKISVHDLLHAAFSARVRRDLLRRHGEADL